MKTVIKQVLFGKKKLWTPANIPTELWFSFADNSSIILTANKISQWNDKSGNNRHAMETVDANRPLASNGGVTFDGVDDKLTTSSTFSLPTNRNSFFLVEKNLGGGTGSAPYSFSASTNGSGIVYQSNVGLQPFSSVVYSQPSGRMLLVTQGNNIGYINGVLSAITFGDGLYSNSLFSVGRRIVGDLYTSGTIYEVVVFSGELSTEIIDKLFGYAAFLYGLQSQLPANHPYKRRPPYR